MTRMLTALVVMAFAFAPFAHAVECLMHHEEARSSGIHGEGVHAGGHSDGYSGGHRGMPVADCFQSVMEGVVPALTPMPAKAPDDGMIAAVAPLAWRHAAIVPVAARPPPAFLHRRLAENTLLLTGRRRI